MAHSAVRLYGAVFAALLVLTVATVTVSYVDLGPASVVVALAIAFTKAVLVVLFFMHLRESSGLIWVVAGGGFFWLAILIGLTMSDVDAGVAAGRSQMIAGAARRRGLESAPWNEPSSRATWRRSRSPAGTP